MSATAEVLFTQTFWLGDAQRHQLPLLRVLADFEKIFNTLQLPLIDALQQGRGSVRGFLGSVRRLLWSLFSGSRVCLDTRVGLTPAVPVIRGIPQGAVSSPELSKAAQDPILRLRAADGAAYRAVRCLPAVLNSLSQGSRATGVGYAWSKFSAYASDWDAAFPLLDPRLRIDGATVSSWDIWQGGVREFILPRSPEDQVD